MSYFEQREHDKLVRRAKKKLESAEEEVSRIEKDLRDIEDRIAKGESGDEIFKIHALTNKALENAMSLWELACLELEEIK